MASLGDDGFEIVGVTSSSIQRPIRPRSTRAVTRKSTRTTTKLPSIPRAASPSQQPVVQAVGLNINHPSKRTVTNPIKRKRSTSDASRSGRARSASLSYDEERDELEEGPSRKYKRPSPRATKSAKAKKASTSKDQDKDDTHDKGTGKGKGKKTEKEPKPKKVAKAGLERAKLEELRKDAHFGKLDDAVIKRIAKVHLERMYLIHRFRNGDQLREEFDVSGSKGNVYKVVVDRQVSCSCMDFALRRQVCKHLMFVYSKVLRLEGHLPVYSRVRLSEDEVEQVFEEALANPVAQALAKPELRKAWEAAVGYQPDDGEAASGSDQDQDQAPVGKRLIPGEGDVCGVCYEDLEPGSVEGLEFCLGSCGRPIHTDCLETWFNTRGFNRTCIWCRAKWHEPIKAPVVVDRKANGYGIGLSARGGVVDAFGRPLNLAAAAGLNEPAPLEPAAEADAADDGADGWE